MKDREFVKGHIEMGVSTLFFGLNFLALKYLMPTWLDGYDATFFRLAGATLLFWIASFFVKKQKMERDDWKTFFLSGVLGLFPFMLFFNLAVQHGSPVDVSIIMTTPPLLVAIISMIVFKTKISKQNGLGIFLSLGGAVFLIMIGSSSGAHGRSMESNLLAVLSAISYAVFLVMMNTISSKYNTVILLRWIFLYGTILAVPLGILFVEKSPIVQHPTLVPLLVLSFIILFPTFVSYLLIPPAMKFIGHVLVSMYQNILPIIVTVAAVITGMDKLYWDQPVAIAIILLGVYISSRAVIRQRNESVKSEKI